MDIDWQSYLKYVPYVIIIIAIFYGLSTQNTKAEQAVLAPKTIQEATVIDNAVQEAETAVANPPPIVEPTVAVPTATMGLTTGAGSGAVEMTTEHFTNSADAVFPEDYVKYPRAIAHYLVRNWPIDMAKKIFFRRFGRAMTQADLSGPLTKDEVRNFGQTRSNSTRDVLGYPSWKVYTTRDYPTGWSYSDGKPQL